MSRLDIGRYRKALIALATAVVEVVAVWQGAPEWALMAAAGAGAVLVYLVPNRESVRVNITAEDLPPRLLAQLREQLRQEQR